MSVEPGLSTLTVEARMAIMSVEPGLSTLTVEARMAPAAESIYSAFTERLDSWFAAPGKWP
jgi:hypothetical protein